MGNCYDSTFSQTFLTGSPIYGDTIVVGTWGSLQKLVVPYVVITATHPHYQPVSCYQLLLGHIQKTTSNPTTHHLPYNSNDYDSSPS